MEGVFVVEGVVVERIQNTENGNLVGMPRVGDIVCLNEDPPRKVVSVRWYFNTFESRVEINLGDHQ